MIVAILGCGEVGRMFARAAAGHHELMLCDPYPAPATRELADQLGIPLHTAPGDWLQRADRVWSCTTGEISLPAVLDALPHLRPGTIYVDLTTAAPADKRAGEAAASAQGIAYVDVAIMGAVALTGIATPLLAAGDGADAVVHDFASIGAPARALEHGTAGDAIELKLLRTVLTKGVEALAVEAFVAAESKGVRHELTRVLSDIDEQGFTSFLDAVVRTHLVHAERRLHEVERAIAQLDDENLPTEVLEGARLRFELSAAALQTDPPTAGTSDDIDASVAWLLNASRRANAGL